MVCKCIRGGRSLKMDMRALFIQTSLSVSTILRLSDALMFLLALGWAGGAGGPSSSVLCSLWRKNEIKAVGGMLTSRELMQPQQDMTDDTEIFSLWVLDAACMYRTHAKSVSHETTRFLRSM